MKRLFLMFTMLALVISIGCQEAPPEDPEFIKKQADMEELQPEQGQKLQQAPEA